MIKNVFDEISSFENILQAAKDCSAGRRYEKSGKDWNKTVMTYRML